MQEDIDWALVGTERRAKIMYLADDDVLDFLITHQDTTRVKRISLPENCRIHSVYIDNRRQAFAFLILSNEFDQVPKGAMLPELETHKDWYLEADIKIPGIGFCNPKYDPNYCVIVAGEDLEKGDQVYVNLEDKCVKVASNEKGTVASEQLKKRK